MLIDHSRTGCASSNAIEMCRSAFWFAKKMCSFFANDDWQHNCCTSGAQTSAFANGCPCHCRRHINSPGGNSGVPDYGTCEKGASEAKVSEVVVSNVDPLLARMSFRQLVALRWTVTRLVLCLQRDLSIKACLQNDDCVKEISSDVPSCRADGEALSREPLTLPL